MGWITFLTPAPPPHQLLLPPFPLFLLTLPADFFNFLSLRRLGHHTDYIDEHSLPDRMVSFAGVVGNLFILCHPQRLKILRRIFIIFGTVRACTSQQQQKQGSRRSAG